uniref:Uncharacterized protein n=1 Tax=Heterorhabditis bacteriophora TaxID=37862 RepID=A0A1I7WYR2_HETBA
MKTSWFLFLPIYSSILIYANEDTIKCLIYHNSC